VCERFHRSVSWTFLDRHANCNANGRPTAMPTAGQLQCQRHANCNANGRPTAMPTACQQFFGPRSTLRCPLPLQPDRARGVLTEQRTFPDVPAKHHRSPVTGLIGDDALGNARLSGGRRKTGPQ